MNNYDLTAWFVHALTTDVNTIVEWRCIHDKNKGIPAHNFSGTLAEQYETLVKYNNDGYGIFCSINVLDGLGRELNNVSYIRSHVVDLDNTLTAQSSYDRAAADGASFAVQSSPGKYHVYWKVQPYEGNEFYKLTQRKLNQYYDADRQIIDATRVMRVPGFLHQKYEPVLVTAWPLPNADKVHTSDELTSLVASVNIVEHMSTRTALGEPSLAAPSLEWLQFAVDLVDPNDMDRGEWLSFSAAMKQAAWSLTDPQTVQDIWAKWCERYSENDAAENLKLWNSVVDTEVGWTSIERKSTVKAYMMFHGKDKAPPSTVPTVITPSKEINLPATTSAADVALSQIPKMGEMINQHECQVYFNKCYFVAREGKIFNHGRFMNATQFNGQYGGKLFIISSEGKTTDEPFKAALRSSLYQIPKVDHVRFLPDRPTFDIIPDALGRDGLNTYIPANIDSKEGDVSLWLDHMKRILPNDGDRKIFFDYMAHCVKFPGYKIPWAPLLQSAEGIGKSIIFEVLQHALGEMYIYSPKAPELVKSGSTFNAWQRGKLLIMVNEIKIDERRELIEILKPMISDNRIEIQSKGVDQEMEDNPANWLFFSNWKDAVPITKNGRRYSIFYSVLQFEADILNAGMDDAYFNRIWSWLRDGGGKEALAHWLLNYPIEKGALPMRAPKTSNHAEALALSRSPIEVVVDNCIQDGICGFKGGYVSVLAVIAQAKASGMRQPGTRTVQTCLENLGYINIGRAVRPHLQEDVNQRAQLYSLTSTTPVEGYGIAQGYD